jgi:hypothetical protein
MATTTTPTQMFEDFASKAVDSMDAWANANQKILKHLVDVSVSTASEGVRIYTELQSSAVEAARTSQDLLAVQQQRLKDLSKDPVATYQQEVVDAVSVAQRGFKLLESNAETVARSADRLQKTAEEAGKSIQATLASLATQLKTLYTADTQHP